jgi:hypothetical protein
MPHVVDRTQLKLPYLYTTNYPCGSLRKPTHLFGRGETQQQQPQRHRLNNNNHNGTTSPSRGRFPSIPRAILLKTATVCWYSRQRCRCQHRWRKSIHTMIEADIQLHQERGHFSSRRTEKTPRRDSVECLVPSRGCGRTPASSEGQRFIKSSVRRQPKRLLSWSRVHEDRLVMSSG